MLTSLIHKYVIIHFEYNCKLNTAPRGILRDIEY